MVIFGEGLRWWDGGWNEMKQVLERDGEGSVIRRKEGDFPETLETIFIIKEGDESLRGKL